MAPLFSQHLSRPWDFLAQGKAATPLQTAGRDLALPAVGVAQMEKIYACVFSIQENFKLQFLFSFYVILLSLFFFKGSPD